MPTSPLICHRSTPSVAITSIDVSVERRHANRLQFRYAMRGNIAHVAVPTPAAAQHTDLLWHHTCCEAFITAEGDSAYVECNFSPSGAWAVYHFSGYRKHMRNLVPLDPPRITLLRQPNELVLEAEVQLSEFATVPLRVGVTTIVEEVDNSLSYWALRHPRSKPEFHHRAGFILRLD